MDPFVSANVVYFNSHGFPRAAIITATRDSLAGEQHVSLLEHDRDVHLVVFSPLPRTYPELHVPYGGGSADLAPGDPGTWCWPNQAPPARTEAVAATAAQAYRIR